jgi:hypothetical protein
MDKDLEVLFFPQDQETNISFQEAVAAMDQNQEIGGQHPDVEDKEERNKNNREDDGGNNDNDDQDDDEDEENHDDDEEEEE